MKEHLCQIFSGNGAEKLARLRYIAKNKIKTDKSRTASIRRKQRMALIEESYLEAVFLAGCNEMVEN